MFAYCKDIGKVVTKDRLRVSLIEVGEIYRLGIK